MNLNTLKKDQLLWLIDHKCCHGMKYIEHPNCYQKDYPNILPGGIPERLGFLDCEATNLAASFGYAFSYAIKELNGKIYGRVLTPKEIRSFIFDKKLMTELCSDLRKFDKVVVHYGSDYRFDLPFLRTRALYYGLSFPEHRTVFVEDTYSMSKSKLKLHRNRLETICEFFDIPAKQHKMNPAIWQKALAGHGPSLAYIWKHNIEDVDSLEAVWKKLNPYVSRTKRSL